MLRVLLLMACVVSGQSWQPQVSGVSAGLRGISAVNARVAYAGGTQGTILKTTDGGATWQNVSPSGSADADFRDLEALNEREVSALSSGAGRLSRLYKTSDGGQSWTLARVNTEPDGFWDAISFWDADHAILMGDPENGRFTILTSSDGGANWKQQEGPKAEKGEAAFAASGTSLFTRGAREAWFASGGTGGGRVFHTADGGATWTAVRTPLRPASEGAGISSLVFSSSTRGIAVGGDYRKPDDAAGNIVITQDGGRTWAVPQNPPSGYRSAIAHVSGIWIAVGTSGSDVSRDDGKTWRTFDTAAYNAMSFAPDGSGRVVGPNGGISKLDE